MECVPRESQNNMKEIRERDSHFIRLSTRSKYAAFLFLFCCLRNLGILGFPVISSLQPRSAQSLLILAENQKPNATVLQQLLLTEEQKDICLRENTVHSRADCIAPLLETYYGHNAAVICSGFSLRLAFHKCQGCPWSRINPATLPEMKSLSYPLEPKHLFFENVTQDCLVAKQFTAVQSEDDSLSLWNLAGVYSSVLLALISLLGAFPGIANGLREPVTLFVWKLSEEWYQLFLWGAYVHFNMYFGVSMAYTVFCDSVFFIFCAASAQDSGLRHNLVDFNGPLLAASLSRNFQLDRHPFPKALSISGKVFMETPHIIYCNLSLTVWSIGLLFFGRDAIHRQDPLFFLVLRRQKR